MVYILYFIKHFLYKSLYIEDTDEVLEKIIVNYYGLIPRKKKGINDRHARRKLIISLTSIPSRIDKVWITVESLLRQTYKPDKIILWLAKDEFQNVRIPEKLRQQEKRGLTIRYCDNLGSYKKFYYTVIENPEAYLVTVDDDIIYAETMLGQLIKEYRKNPGNIICTRSHLIHNRKGKLLPYNNWGVYEKRKGILKEATFQNFFTSGAGTLFPMFRMNQKVLLKKDIFMNIAPSADDVWLNFNAWIAGVRTKDIDSILGNYISIKNSSDKGLFRINKRKNDEQIRKTLNYMNINIDDYLKRN